MSSRSSHPSRSSRLSRADAGSDGTTAPRRGSVADFPPIFTGGRRGVPRLRRLLRPRRVLASVFALSAVGATASAVAPSPDTARAARAAHAAPPSRPGEEKVSAPVRLADAAAVRLLRPGDRVDVIATDAGAPRVVARCAPVERVPHSAAPTGTAGPAHTSQWGALVVLRLSRSTATELAGAAAASPPAVALC